MSKKEDWEIKYDKKQKERIQGMKNMTDEQNNAINELYDAVNDIVIEIQECFDVRMSDVAKLEDAKWKIYHAFNYQDRK
jgi:hypothetical protein